ncbi:MAG: zinc-binding dehydrogenase [Dysgonamonadaceae bacterium]|jgi:threonine dehydrogenase-like Zn-dependent dehydrogenase|nr:zinc-binding dehydrogenase [Dysgonamonadaceae bacterium]
MKTKAVRLYGKNDLRLEEFDLPAIKDNEILAKVICDSICMSSYKATHEADIHKRVPRNVAENPVIIGHEFAGEIVEVGAKWSGEFIAGEKFSIQPALNDPNGPVGILSAPGYSYGYIGGDATYIIIPDEVMKNGCLLHYTGKGYYPASLSEPLSCVIGAMHANYHTTPGSYIHNMEIRDGGNMAILAGVGPMGLAAINYAINRTDRKPRLIVVTDIDRQRLDRAALLYSVEEAAKNDIKLLYVNTGAMEKPEDELRALTGGKGYDDVFVFAPVAPIIEQADGILAFDGCLNFFAGPAKTDFKAPFNFYNVHYASSHVVGTSGGNTDDMKEALAMMVSGLDPAGLVTHIGGINAVIDTTMNLPSIPGGKKLIYTHIDMPLTSIAEFGERGKADPLFAELNRLCERNNGLWNIEAEEYLLKNF